MQMSAGQSPKLAQERPAGVLCSELWAEASRLLGKKKGVKRQFGSSNVSADNVLFSSLPNLERNSAFRLLPFVKPPNQEFS